MGDVLRSLQLVHENIDRLAENKRILESDCSALEASVAEKQGYIAVGKDAIASAHLQRLQVTTEAAVEEASVSRFGGFVSTSDKKLEDDAGAMIAARASQVKDLRALAAQVSALVSDPLSQASKKREEMAAALHKAREEVAAKRAEKERQLKLLEEARAQRQQVEDKIAAANARIDAAAVVSAALQAEAAKVQQSGQDVVGRFKSTEEKRAKSEKEAGIIDLRKREAEGRQQQAVAKHAEASAKHLLVTGRNPPDRLKL